MKKRLFLTFFLSLFLMPMIAKADMGSPVLNYEVRVSNADGAQTYDIIYKDNKDQVVKEDVILKYDTVLKVEHEEKVNGTEYLSVFYKNKDTDRTEFTYVLASDVILNKDYDLEEYKNKDSINMVVFREGAYLYKGPSFRYDKVDGGYMLPVGAEIKTKYYDEVFAYVEYQGHKGWLYIYQYDEDLSPYDTMGFLADKYDISKDKYKMYTIQSTKIYKDLTNTKGDSVTIPANTLIEPKLSYLYHPHYRAFLITYKGNDYWLINDDDVIKEDNPDKEYIILFEDTKLYAEPGTYENNFKPSKTTGKVIPKYTKLVYDKSYATEYGQDRFYEVTYEGKTGWVYYNSDDEREIAITESNNYEDAKAQINSDLKLYKSPYKSNEIGTIPSGKTIEYLFYGTNGLSKPETILDTWVYVTTKGYTGWAKYDEEVFNNKAPEDRPSEPDPEPEIVKPNKKSGPKGHKPDEKETNKVMFYSIIGCSAVVLIGISVLVLTIFINKKKKKAELVNDEVNIEETSTVKEEVTETPSEDVTPEKPKKSKTKKEKTDN